MTTSPLEQTLQQMRRTGNQGRVIPLHRSLLTLGIGNRGLVEALVLFILFEVLLAFGAPTIIQIWAQTLDSWISLTQLPGEIAWTRASIYGTDVPIPYPMLPADGPSAWFCLLVAVGCGLLILVSYFMPDAFLPVAYFLRAAAVIQLSACALFAFWPEVFLHRLANHTGGGMALGMQFLFLVPILMALIYYLFDFSFWQKLRLTLIILLYFILTIPLQYMLHAWILHQATLLFLPLLYLLFGLLLNVLLFVAFYAWGMSWPCRPIKG